jgi:hypothetical protein
LFRYGTVEDWPEKVKLADYKDLHKWYDICLIKKRGTARKYPRFRVKGEKTMELLVGCALVVVVYCSYVTLKEIIVDLHSEGVFQAFAGWRKRPATRVWELDRLMRAGSLTADENLAFLPRRSAIRVRMSQ